MINENPFPTLFLIQSLIPLIQKEDFISPRFLFSIIHPLLISSEFHISLLAHKCFRSLVDEKVIYSKKELLILLNQFPQYNHQNSFLFFKLIEVFIDNDSPLSSEMLIQIDQFVFQHLNNPQSLYLLNSLSLVDLRFLNPKVEQILEQCTNFISLNIGTYEIASILSSIYKSFPEKAESFFNNHRSQLIDFILVDSDASLKHRIESIEFLHIFHIDLNPIVQFLINSIKIGKHFVYLSSCILEILNNLSEQNSIDLFQTLSNLLQTCNNPEHLNILFHVLCEFLTKKSIPKEFYFPVYQSLLSGEILFLRRFGIYVLSLTSAFQFMVLVLDRNKSEAQKLSEIMVESIFEVPFDSFEGFLLPLIFSVKNHLLDSNLLSKLNNSALEVFHEIIFEEENQLFVFIDLFKSIIEEDLTYSHSILETLYSFFEDNLDSPLFDSHGFSAAIDLALKYSVLSSFQNVKISFIPNLPFIEMCEFNSSVIDSLIHLFENRSDLPIEDFAFLCSDFIVMTINERDSFQISPPLIDEILTFLKKIISQNKQFESKLLKRFSSSRPKQNRLKNSLK